MSPLSKILNTESELLLGFGLEQQKPPVQLSSANSPLIGRATLLPSKDAIMLMIEQKQLNQAFALLDPLCKDPIMDVEYLALRAAAYIKNNNHVHALQDTEKALTIAPQDPRLLRAQANLRTILFEISIQPPAKKQKTARN